MSERTPLVYKKISNWQTRVLYLEPGYFGSPLVAQLHVADLIHGDDIVLHEQQKRASYRALSYCWGEPVLCSELLCDGRKMSITENLYAALQRSRDSGEGLFLWVDAVCINQQDTEERAQQVRNMLLIYSKAKEVIVWLGACPAASRHDMDDLIARSKKHRSSSNLDSVPGDLLKALNELARAPWLGRIWVLQEVWAANAVVVRYGDKSTTWEKLSELGSVTEWAWEPHDYNLTTLLKRISRSSRRSRLLVGLKDEPNQFLKANESKDHEMPESDLLAVIRRTSGSQCSDLRDHIYGILGMSSTNVSTSLDTVVEDDSSRLLIDYSEGKTLGSVYEDVARYIMSRDRALNILYLQGKLGSVIVNGEKLPSWVPNWRRPFSTRGWMQYCQQCNFLDLSNIPRHMPKPQPAAGILDLEGFRLAAITTLIPEKATDKLYPSVDRVSDRVFRQFQDAYATEPPVMKFVLHALNLALAKDFQRRVLDRTSDLTAPRSLKLPVLYRSHDPPVLVDLQEDEVLFRPVTRSIAVDRNTSMQNVEDNMPATWIFAHIGPPPFPGEKDLSRAKVQKIREWFSIDEESEHDGLSTWTTDGERFPTSWAVPPEAQIGDLIVVVRGGLMPIVVRRGSDTPTWQYIGPAAMAETVAGNDNETRPSWVFNHFISTYGTRLGDMLKACVEDNAVEQFQLS